jgi:LmbE family N-acetylglucosaminyl deacetylase
MRLSFAEDRVLAVMAHPDDAELLCAGTLARAKADGAAALGLCVMCQGDKGVPAAGVGDDLVAVRKREASEAAAVLAATLYWLEARDGELFDTYERRLKLIEVLRQFRPTLVITHGPEDYHPDHRAAYAIAEAATWMAASRGQRTQSPPIAEPPGLWMADPVAMMGFAPEFYVDVTAHVETKRRMLACHRSQLLRGGDPGFAPLEELMLRQCRARGEQSGVDAAEAFRQHQAFKQCRAW